MPNDKLLPCETNATPAPWSVDDTGPIACKQDIGRACVFIWGQDGEGMGAVAQVYGEAGGDAVADAELIVALRNSAQPAQSTADRTDELQRTMGLLTLGKWNTGSYESKMLMDYYERRLLELNATSEQVGKMIVEAIDNLTAKQKGEQA